MGRQYQAENPFQGEHLIVSSPVTTDGTTPRIGPDGRVVYKEDLLPVSALKMLEKKNLKLPEHLRKKIKRVEAYQPPVQTEPVKQKAKK